MDNIFYLAKKTNYVTRIGHMQHVISAQTDCRRTVPKIYMA